MCLLFPSFNHTFHYSRCSSHCSFPHFLSLLGGDRWTVIRGVHRRWRHGMLSVPAVPGQLSTWSSTHHRAAEWHSQQRPGKSVGITCCRIVFVCAYYNIYILFIYIYIYLFVYYLVFFTHIINIYLYIGCFFVSRDPFHVGVYWPWVSLVRDGDGERRREREKGERERDVWKIHAQNRGTSIFLLGYPLVN